jgi:aromatic ring hydroxylase
MMEEDKDYAIAFAVSANTPGLKIIVDRSLLEDAFKDRP